MKSNRDLNLMLTRAVFIHTLFYIHNLSSWQIKPEKNSGLNGIRTHDLCDTSAVLYQIPEEDEGMLKEYMKDHIFELRRKI